MRILVIDDSPADRELAIRGLAEGFPDAVFAEVGRKPEFSAALAEGGFDAVLTDFRLHWADGLRVLKEVRNRYPYVPVVFVTESGSEEIAVEAMKAGLSDYVLKQHPGRLPVALRESLEKAALRARYDSALAELEQAHAQLQAAAEGLERRVEARTAELGQANEDLRRQGAELRQEMAERRRVEEEREQLFRENRQQRELLEHLIESAPVGIAVIRGADLCYESANPAFLAITGTQALDPGSPCFAEASPRLDALATEMLEPALQTGEPVSMREYECRPPDRPDARLFWDLDVVPLHDASGDAVNLLLLINDVTQKVLARMQAEELALQLAAERRFLHNIMNSVPVAISYVDRDLVYRQCNQAASREIGHPVEQLLGRRVPEMLPGNEHIWAALEGVLQTGEPYPLRTITARWQNRPDAPERHYLTAYLPDKDEAGRVQGVFATGQDITELVDARRRLEELAEALRTARDELDVRVQERTAELEAIFASLPDAVYVGDENGIQRTNQIALDVLGCRNLEDLHDVIPALSAKLQNRFADTGARLRPEDEPFVRALNGKPSTLEMVSRNLATGADIILRSAARPILLGGRIIGAVAVNTDITEQKRTERTLRQQRQQLQILHDMDRAILAVQSPAAIAQAVTGALEEATGGKHAMVVLFNRDSTRAEVLAGSHRRPEAGDTSLSLENYWPLRANLRGDPGIVDDVAALPLGDPLRAAILSAGIRCFAGIPMATAERVIGALVVGFAEPGPLPDETAGFLRQVADQLALGIRQAQLFEDLQTSRGHLRSLSHQLVTLQEAERKSLSRELHDRSGQSMTALKIQLSRLKRQADNADAVRAHVEELLQMADAVLSDLHDLAVNLRPSTLDRYGLAPALQQYVDTFQKQNRIDVAFAATGLDGQRLPEELETTIYRIVQEALTNITRHAPAQRAEINVDSAATSVAGASEISVRIADDGRGFDVEEALRGRLGLLGMRERAEMVGGSLVIQSQPGSGTTVSVRALVPKVE